MRPDESRGYGNCRDAGSANGFNGGARASSYSRGGFRQRMLYRLCGGSGFLRPHSDGFMNLLRLDLVAFCELLGHHVPTHVPK